MNYHAHACSTSDLRSLCPVEVPMNVAEMCLLQAPVTADNSTAAWYSARGLCSADDEMTWLDERTLTRKQYQEDGRNRRKEPNA
jgi:hypothetical protein